MSYNQDPIGFIIGETTPGVASFLATRPPKLGEYVIIEHDEGPMLGMVEDSRAGNPFIPPDITRLETVKKLKEMLGESGEYLRGKARILTDLNSLLEKRKVNPPKTPPKTGYRVFEADNETLKKIFDPTGKGEEVPAYYDENFGGAIRIGFLANHPEVPVFIRVNPFVSRHSAILAVTGAGKSNTVSIIADRMVNHLNATILLFDMHSEYTLSRIGGRKFNLIKPKINPVELTLTELEQLARIRENATKQQRVLRQVYKIANKYVQLNPDKRREYIDFMIDILETLLGGEEPEIPEEDKGLLRTLDKDAISGVLNKLDDLRDIYSSILDPYASYDLKSVVKPGYLNIIDLGEVDEKGSEVIVSYYARRILMERKMNRRNPEAGYPTPVLLIMEEAHILVPKDEDRLTKRWIARIAREGRKFGVGLCLVSQRPKNIDENALSQTNNKIILKIVEPNDKQYVQRSSEQLSDELLELLPSLRVGEAIILGEFTPLPALVKIDEHPEKKIGRDLNVSQIWMSQQIKEKKIEEEVDEYLNMLKG